MCSLRLLGGSHNTLYGAAIQSAPRWRTVRGATYSRFCARFSRGYTLSVRENGAMVSFKCAREAPGLPGAVCWEPGCHAGRVQRPSEWRYPLAQPGRNSLWLGCVQGREELPIAEPKR